jgi:hypothetical protein
LHYLSGMCSASQWSPFMAELETTRRPLPNGQACVRGKAIVRIQCTLFSYPHSFLSPHLEFHVSPLKNQIHPLVCICITFGLHSFDYYYFFFYHFLNLFYFSIKSLIILFYLVFCIRFDLHCFNCYLFLNFLWLWTLLYEFIMFVIYGVILISLHELLVLKTKSV